MKDAMKDRPFTNEEAKPEEYPQPDPGSGPQAIPRPRKAESLWHTQDLATTKVKRLRQKSGDR